MKKELIIFENRYTTRGVVQKISLKTLFRSFKQNVIRTSETVLEYQKGTKDFRLKCKDKGGFIAGRSENNSRKNIDIKSRNMITLDMDYCPANILEILKDKQDIKKELQFAFFVYSTHSHTAEKPRLRLMVPLKEKITPEQYEPIAKIIAKKIGEEYFDATTFQPNRLMYLPSVSVDGDYICESFGFDDWFELEPKEFLNKYLNYLNIHEFQKPLYIEGIRRKHIEKGNYKSSTKTKFRIVNAFNTEYTIKQTIDEFLTDEYVAGKSSDRYTYTKGESKEGLIILNSQYAYSHHATDPAQGRLLNAFDILRIHKFGKVDTDITEQKEYENYAKTSSFSLMTEFIQKNLSNVMKHMPELVNLEKNQKEFHTNETIVEKSSVESKDWKLTLDYTGANSNRHPKSNARNTLIIFKNDNYFKDLFYYDSLRDAICFNRPPKWNLEKKKGEMVTDEDDSEIRIYLNSVYQITGKDLAYDTVLHTSAKKRRHPIKTFFASLPEWDQIPRIETIVCDLFNIRHNTFFAEASKKWWTAIIQRVMIPGSKFDMILVISGEQGIGKSQFGKSIATLKWNGDMTTIDSQPNFFGDDELHFEKKDAYEQLNGIMVYELPEFEKYYKKTDVRTVKSFLSKTSDKYRRSYGRRVAEYKRQCVFIATTNDNKPLRDVTGNRRFLPFYAQLKRHESWLYDPKKWNEDIRNQCLAEALHYFHNGYNPMSSFSKEAVRIWEELNEKATVENDSLPIVEMYLENKFPKNFFRKDIIDMKRDYSQTRISDYDGDYIHREYRTEFSLKEIFTFAFNKQISDTPDFRMREQIQNAFHHLGFVKQAKRKRQGVLGQQTVYKKEGGEKDET